MRLSPIGKELLTALAILLAVIAAFSPMWIKVQHAADEYGKELASQ